MTKKETPFEVEWQATFIGVEERYCKIQTKKKIYKVGSFKKSGELYKGAKPKEILIFGKLYYTMAIHIVLSHNALIQQQNGKDLETVISEHIDRRMLNLKKDMMFYLGIKTK